MKIDVIALFPEIIFPALQVGILSRAQDADVLTVNVHSLRDFTTDRHKSVDDYPYGGEAGMILKPEPLFRAVRTLNPQLTARAGAVLSGRLWCNRYSRFSIRDAFHGFAKNRARHPHSRGARAQSEEY